MEPLYIGITTAKVGEPVLPEVPPSYRGKPKGVEWLEEKRLLLQEAAATTPLLGRVVTACVLDAGGNTLFEGEQHGGVSQNSVAALLVSWLVDRLDDQLRDTPVGDDTPCNYLLCGVNVQQVLAVAAFEAMQLGEPVPVKLWRSPRYMYDPFEMLATATQRLVTLDAAFRAFNQPVPPPEPWTARESAQYSRQLAQMLQLFGAGIPAVKG